MFIMCLHTECRVISSNCLSVIDIMRKVNYRPQVDATRTQYCFKFYCSVDITGKY
jgi:hypothetical protein